MKAGAGGERAIEGVVFMAPESPAGSRKVVLLSHCYRQSHSWGLGGVAEGEACCRGQEKSDFSSSFTNALFALSSPSVPITMVTSPFLMTSPILVL